MKNFKIRTKLAIGFGITIIMIVLGGWLAIESADSLANTTASLYHHPMAVSTSVRDVNTNLVAIHRNMKDVAMATTIDQLDEAVVDVKARLESTEAAFAILNESFLGDKSDIKLAEDLFAAWLPIRVKVQAQTKLQIESDASAIANTEGREHSAKITAAIDTLIAFAGDKATEFHSNSQLASDGQAAELVDKFYKHPFTVSTTALQVKSNLLMIVRNVKDVVSANSVDTLDRLDAAIDKIEEETLAEFGLIEERYLGDKSKVQEAEQLVRDWKPIRDNIIATRRAYLSVDPGKVTREEGGPHLAKLIEVLDKIQDFADKKGVAFNVSAEKQASSSKSTLLLVFGLAVVLAVVFGTWITRMITVPMAATVNMVEELNRGNLDIRLNIQQRDEVGRLADALDQFANNMQNEVVAAFEALADSNLTFEAQGVIKAPLAKANASLNDVMSQLQVAGNQINGASGQVADSSQTLSQGATETAASLEEISSSMNEMAAQTQQSADNANQANQLTAEASEAASRGGKQMQSMVAAMAEINEAGRDISKIIKTIDEIAFQTNLLALNAAVEAARAGNHGKGFAVVAEEVRNLAARSAKAASETAELIEGSVQKTENGTLIAGQTSAALEEIVAAILKVTDLVAEIAAASSEQAQGISQVNQGLTQIDQGVQASTATAEESAAASEELSGQAEQLRHMLSRFKLIGGDQPLSQPQLSVPSAPVVTNDGWGESQQKPQSLSIDLDGDDF